MEADILAWAGASRQRTLSRTAPSLVVHRGRTYSYVIRLTSGATDEPVYMGGTFYRSYERRFAEVVQGAHPPTGRQSLPGSVHQLHETWFPPGPHGYRTFFRDGAVSADDDSCQVQLSNDQRIYPHQIVIEMGPRYDNLSSNYLTNAWFFSWDHSAARTQTAPLVPLTETTFEVARPSYVYQDRIVVSWRYGEGNRIRFQAIGDGDYPAGRHWSVLRPTQTISIRDWTEREVEYLRLTDSEVPSVWFKARNDASAAIGQTARRPGCFPRDRSSTTPIGQVLVHHFVDDQAFVPPLQLPLEASDTPSPS